MKLREKDKLLLEEDDIYRRLAEYEDKSEEDYYELLDSIKKIEEIKTERAKRKSSTGFWSKLDPNTLVVSGISISEMLLVLNYEKLSALTSRALMFKLRPRLRF